MRVLVFLYMNTVLHGQTSHSQGKGIRKGKFKCSNDITFRYGTVEVEIERP